MYIPTFEQFVKMTETLSLIPIHKEVMADTETPISLFKKIGTSGPSFLLESVEGGERWGRYSYIGIHPSSFFLSRGRETILIRRGKRKVFEGPPLEALRRFLDVRNVPKVKDLPDFTGGAVGYIGYDFVRNLEALPEIVPDDLGLPEAYLMIADELIIFDHLRQTIRVLANVHVGSRRDKASAYHEATDRLESLLELISKPFADNGIAPGEARSPRFSSDISREQFSRKVEKIKEAIYGGEAIQVVFSQRIESPFSGDPFDIYRRLRQINPSPYLFYLNLPHCILLGASPELLVRLHDGLIDLRPIAGTRPRGKDSEQESQLEAELLADEKERAEHVMLVDLGRNDIGRVSQPGSVKVTDMMSLEKYSHVIHIVSHIQGKLENDRDCFDLLRACFPAGTVSGAPKVRAMEIIEEMETQRRGPYAGAVGYFTFSGDMELCITIRSILISRGKAFVQVGAGIVADSHPEREYLETVHKAEAMIQAIESAGKGGGAGDPADR